MALLLGLLTFTAAVGFGHYGHRFRERHQDWVWIWQAV